MFENPKLNLTAKILSTLSPFMLGGIFVAYILGHMFSPGPIFRSDMLYIITFMVSILTLLIGLISWKYPKAILIWVLLIVFIGVLLVANEEVNSALSNGFNKGLCSAAVGNENCKKDDYGNIVCPGFDVPTIICN